MTDFQEKRKSFTNDEDNNIDLSHSNSNIKNDSKSNSSNKVLIVSKNSISSKQTESLVNGRKRNIRTSKTLETIDKINEDRKSKNDGRVSSFFFDQIFEKNNVFVCY